MELRRLSKAYGPFPATESSTAVPLQQLWPECAGVLETFGTVNSTAKWLGDQESAMDNIFQESKNIKVLQRQLKSKDSNLSIAAREECVKNRAAARKRLVSVYAELDNSITKSMFAEIEKDMSKAPKLTAAIKKGLAKVPSNATNLHTRHKKKIQSEMGVASSGNGSTAAAAAVVVVVIAEAVVVLNKRSAR